MHMVFTIEKKTPAAEAQPGRRPKRREGAAVLRLAQRGRDASGDGAREGGQTGGAMGGWVWGGWKEKMGSKP